MLRANTAPVRPALTVSHEFFETNGIRLHCAVQVPADGHGNGTIVFVHGFPEFWYGWKNQIPEFAQDHRVVAPDLRGFNLSDKPEGVEAYAVKEIVADLVGLFDALGEERVTVVAHDWGGAVAWPLAAQYPDRLNKLVILNAPHPSTFLRELQRNPAQQQASQYVNLLRSPRAEDVLSRDNFALMKKFAFGTMSSKAGFTEDDRDAYLRAWQQPGALTASLNYYRGMKSGPLDLNPANSHDGQSQSEASIPTVSVHVPTLVIWGMRDTALLPGILDGLDEFVPNLRIHRIANAGHWVQHEAADEVNQVIRQFLRE